MAVYGDMLLFFPELFRRFKYFKMIPRPVASYFDRMELGMVKGVFQYLKKGELEREDDTLNDVNVPVLWTRQKLEMGNFIEHEDIIYRIKNDYPWMYEGGFYCYGLETTVSNTDKQTRDEEVNLGQNGYV